MSHRTDPENSGETGIFADAGADAGAVETKTVPTLADVLATVEACQDLPEAIKAGILAMVRAANELSMPTGESIP